MGPNRVPDKLPPSAGGLRTPRVGITTHARPSGAVQLEPRDIEGDLWYMPENDRWPLAVTDAHGLQEVAQVTVVSPAPSAAVRSIRMCRAKEVCLPGGAQVRSCACCTFPPLTGHPDLHGLEQGF